MTEFISETTMPRPKLIGFCGYARTGKTTAARYLCSDHGFMDISFATPIKDMLSAILKPVMWGNSGQYVSGERKNEPLKILGGKSAREAMQTLGTEWGRKMISETLWEDLAMSRVDRFMHGYDTSVVIDDVRFQNEVDAIKARGGFVFCIKKSGIGPANGHESENTDFLNLDGHIWNDGPMDMLYERIDAQLQKVGL